MLFHFPPLAGIRRARAAVLGLLVGALLGSPASAHHSFSMFDLTKTEDLQGVVTDFQWTNPHVYVELLVPGGQAGPMHYSIELLSPSLLMRQGWTHNMIKTGDKVSLVIYPLRNGERGGALYSVTLADGRTLKTGLNADILKSTRPKT